jgi:hypothetical protein
MLTLPELLRQLQFITQDGALLGLFVTASLILMARDWRFLILALLAQYILVGLVLSHLVRPDIATLKVLIGAFVCPILFLSARQVSSSAPSLWLVSEGETKASWWQRLVILFKGQDRRTDSSEAMGTAFTSLLALLMILVATTLSNMVLLPGLSLNITTAVYWLILVGLMTLTLAESPLKVGLGLFTTLTGFELFYTTVESSLLITGLWGTINLLIALAIAYLTVVEGIGPEEEG